MTKKMLKPGTYLYPLPAVLVTAGEEGEDNIITVAWAGTLCSDPPMVGIGVRPQRHSHGLLVKTGEFVVNVPTADQVEKVDLCGMKSGRKDDKFKLAGFTRAPAAKVRAPLLAECPLNLECVVRSRVSLGSHDLFIGEVVAVHVDEAALDERQRLVPERLNPLIYHYQSYWSLGQRLLGYGGSVRK